MRAISGLEDNLIIWSVAPSGGCLYALRKPKSRKAIHKHKLDLNMK